MPVSASHRSENQPATSIPAISSSATTTATPTSHDRTSASRAARDGSPGGFRVRGGLVGLRARGLELVARALGPGLCVGSRGLRAVDCRLCVLLGGLGRALDLVELVAEAAQRLARVVGEAARRLAQLGARPLLLLQLLLLGGDRRVLV